jgi:alpha-tubulin suppressor-like RCC1 family protein
MRFEHVCAAAAVSACLIGCLKFDPFACSDDTQCDRDGRVGACQSTGYCAYPDIGCATGLRYDEHAGNGLAGNCVDTPDDTGVADDTSGSGSTTEVENTGSESTGGEPPVETDTHGDCGGPGEACCDDDVCDDGLVCAGRACGCAIAVAAGDRHGCALKVDGSVWCWGDNTFGQVRAPVGDPDRVLAPVMVPSVISVTTKAISLSAHDHTCALRDDDLVVCWGANNGGQSDPNATDPTVGPSSATWAQPAGSVAAGGLHTCALRTDGTSATCWGSNARGQLTGENPGPDSVDITTPVFQQIAVGLEHGCGVVQGTLWCWGDNLQGQLAQDPTLVSLSSVPTQVQLAGVDEVATGARHSCARIGNEVWCWGRNDLGQLGDGSGEPQWTPVPVALPPSITLERIASGLDHTCALTHSGDLWCWGSNTSGQLMLEPDAQGNDSYTLVPVEVDAGASVLAFAGGGTHSCALVDTGEIVCWGTNTRGQIGDGTTSYAHTPTQVLLTCP